VQLAQPIVSPSFPSSATMMQPRIVILKDGVDTSQGPPQCHRDAGKLTAAAAATAMALGSLLLCLLCVCCSTGKGQLISNINACEAVTEILKTTLGPRGQCQPPPLCSARAPSNCSERAATTAASNND
jgi:hypothetical protein